MIWVTQMKESFPQETGLEILLILIKDDYSAELTFTW